MFCGWFFFKFYFNFWKKKILYFLCLTLGSRLLSWCRRKFILLDFVLLFFQLIFFRWFDYFSFFYFMFKFYFFGCRKFFLHFFLFFVCVLFFTLNIRSFFCNFFFLYILFRLWRFEIKFVNQNEVALIILCAPQCSVFSAYFTILHTGVWYCTKRIYYYYLYTSHLTWIFIYESKGLECAMR